MQDRLLLVLTLRVLATLLRFSKVSVVLVFNKILLCLFYRSELSIEKLNKRLES